MSSEPALIVDLASIEESVRLAAPYAATRAIAASVLLERNHGAREQDRLDLEHGAQRRGGELRRRAVTDVDRLTYDDPNQTTEEAAEAVAFLVARHVLDRVVYGRLKIRTGADYRLRPPGVDVGDEYERLEVSGIGTGSEPTSQRLREKLEQLAAYPEEPSGFAIVTNFRVHPIEILIGRLAS